MLLLKKKEGGGGLIRFDIHCTCEMFRKKMYPEICDNRHASLHTEAEPEKYE